jgi:peptidoglycan/LPS O-acetylase OafA/YrhL
MQIISSPQRERRVFITEAKPEKDARRIGGLDALRGVAILFVMAGHFLPEAFPALNGGIVATLGGAGVLLFFYLSGYLIFTNLRTQSPAVFLMRRFFKLFPAYWMNVVAIALMAMVLHVGHVPGTQTLLSNFFMVQEFTRNPLINAVYWTLQIEMKFYVLMVLFIQVFGERRIYALLALLLLADAALWPFLHRGSTIVTYLIAFFPGIAAAKIGEKGWNRRGMIEMAIVSATTALSLLAFLPADNLAEALYALLFSALLSVALVKDVRVPVLAFFARISYSHYLYHAAIGYPVIRIVSRFGGAWAALIAASAVTVAVATAAFYGIEKPGIAFGRRLERRLPVRFQAAPAPA